MTPEEWWRAYDWLWLLPRSFLVAVNTAWGKLTQDAILQKRDADCHDEASPTNQPSEVSTGFDHEKLTDRRRRNTVCKHQVINVANWQELV